LMKKEKEPQSFISAVLKKSMIIGGFISAQRYK